MIYTTKIPGGWRGDGILSFIGDRDDQAEFILSSGLPAVEISMVRNEINLPRVKGDSELIGCLAAKHFLERGFRHFARAPFPDDVVNAERYCGLADRLPRASFTCLRRTSSMASAFARSSRYQPVPAGQTRTNG